MTSANALRDFLAPLLPGWTLQFGRWTDDGTSSRYAVVRPAGGLPAELVRRPLFTLVLVGAKNEALSVASAAADAVIEASRTDSGSLVLIQAGEPVGPAFTDDGRAVIQIAISTITV